MGSALVGRQQVELRINLKGRIMEAQRELPIGGAFARQVNLIKSCETA